MTGEGGTGLLEMVARQAVKTKTDYLPALVAILITLLVVLFGVIKVTERTIKISSWEQCLVAKGAVVIQTSPRRCYLPDGRQWAESTRPASGNGLTWEECSKMRGARIQMTYPEVCVAPDGRSAVRVR